MIHTSVSAADVGAYILRKLGQVTTMKLQKLVYYAQAWSLVLDDESLFHEQIEAWANGPVCPALYELHRGQFQITSLPRGDCSRLSAGQAETIDEVLEAYGHLSGADLSILTHREDPWMHARLRARVPPGARCSEVISLESMAMYYGALVEGEE